MGDTKSLQSRYSIYNISVVMVTIADTVCSDAYTRG